MKNISLKDQYEEIRTTCEKLGSELTHQIEELLSMEEIALGFPIQFRIKQFDSIEKKIEHSSTKVENIREVNDLVGLRIIPLFQRNIESIGKLIKDTFDVTGEDDTQKRLKETEFGYSSIHFQIRLRESWMHTPIFKKAGHFPIEIQVCTLAQHIWASASHILQYKNESAVPLPIRRSIHRVSAVLEIVDQEFERVLLERTKYLDQLETHGPGKSLNVDILSKILDEELPPQNKDTKNGEMYADLLAELLYFHVKTPNQLRELIKKYINQILEKESNTVANRKTIFSESVFDPEDFDEDMNQGIADDAERISRGVFFTHAGLVRWAMEFEFGEKWTDYSSSKNINLLEY